MAKKRELEVVIISDVHLGTYGCHAKELLDYLKSIKPKKLIINGDFVDGWQFNKNYWPKEHNDVLRKILKMSYNTEIIWTTGNHDEFLRKFVPINFGNIKILNEYDFVTSDNKRTIVYHGDIFDITIQKAKWLAHIGSWSYDLLILLNRFINNILYKLNKPKISLSKNIKDNVKQAVKFIEDFENVAIERSSTKYDVL